MEDDHEVQQRCYEMLSDKATARRLADRLIEKYPKSSISMRATERAWAEANPYPKQIQ